MATSVDGLVELKTPVDACEAEKGGAGQVGPPHRLEKVRPDLI